MKDFDVTVKADDGDTDTCTNWDWDTLEDLNVSTANTVSRSFTILRACPLITGLEDLTILEDHPSRPWFSRASVWTNRMRTPPCLGT